VRTKTAAKISKIIIIVAVVGIIAWDLVVILLTGAELEASISQAIWDFSRRAPFVPFLTGFFMGHLFWGDPKTQVSWSETKQDRERLSIRAKEIRDSEDK